MALAQAPSSPQTLYAVDPAGSVYRSLDGGGTWGLRNGGPNGVLIVDLLVDSQNPGVVYARTASGDPASILRTRNGGRTWVPVGLEWAAYAVVPDMGTPGALYAATVSGLYHSQNGGDSWTLVGFEGLLVYSVAVDPHDANSLLAAVRSTGPESKSILWKSSDRGATWTLSPLGEVPPRLDSGIPHLVFDPAHAGTAYVFFVLDITEWESVFRTTDNGASWSLLTTAKGIHDLVPSPEGVLFAAAEFGVARSFDGGDTWVPPLPTTTSSPVGPRDVISRVVVSVDSAGTVYAAGSEGIWRSTDGGASWSTLNEGIFALGVSSILVSPAGFPPPSTVLAAAGDGIFRSRDQGAKWARLHSFFDGLQPYVLKAFDPRFPRTVYGVGFDGQADILLKSTNGGKNWRVLPIGYGCGGDSICSVDLPTFVLDPRRPDTLFVSVVSFVHFQGLTEALLRSTDGGRTWTAVTALPGLQSLGIDPKRGNVLYGLTCKGFFKTENAGKSWHRAGAGLPGPEASCEAAGASQRLAIDPRQPQTLYAGTAGHGVYRSTDGGATFQPWNQGLTTGRISVVLVDPANSANVYAGVAGRGVWRWDASLKHWTPLNDGLPAADFTNVLALDPQEPSILYAGTNHHGAFRIDVGTP